MDGFSRTILAYGISHTKMNFDPYQMFAAARTQAGVSTCVLVTDGLQVFCAAATKAFWFRKGFRFTHVRDIHLQKKFNNNCNLHERLNGKFKDHIKTARGFKSEDPAIVHLMMIHHNFFPFPLRYRRHHTCRKGWDQNTGQRQVDDLRV